MPRATFIEAEASAREAVDRAVAAKCSPASLRTLLGVIRVISLYSRTGDRVSVRQIANAVGLSGPAAERQVGRHLAELHQADAVRYQAGQGRGQVGRIDLPKVASGTPVNGDKSGADHVEKVARIAHKSGASRATSRGFPEKPLIRDGGKSRRVYDDGAWSAAESKAVNP